MRKVAVFIASFLILGALILIAGIYILGSIQPKERNDQSQLPDTGNLEKGLRSLESLKKASLGALGIFGDLDTALTNLPRFILQGKGEEAIGILKSMRGKLSDIESALKDNGGAGRFFLPEDILSQLENGKEMLDSFINWADSSETRRVIIVFGNTSELRPGGGFVGSYAEAELVRGGLSKLTFHDINEPDRLLAAKIIPPKPLQAITARWRAADANWFFDFRLSAEKTLSFIERSDLTPSGQRYDGLISVSPTVIKDILSAMGPVTLKDGRVIDENNFLTAIQGDVQAGQAGSSSDPKAILGELTPLIKEKISGSENKTSDLIMQKFPAWAAKKDILFYLRDPGLAASLGKLKLDGSLYEPPKDEKGDYLAVVNANVGGGKSDLTTKDVIDITSNIGADGTVENDLIFTRKHESGNREEWWYRVPNWDYVQVFVPPGSQMISLEGAGVRTITPKADYRRGFETDPDVSVLESSLKKNADFKELDVFEESEREVFATWLKVPEGEDRVLKMRYAREIKPLQNDEEYVFVYEAQQGSSARLNVVLNAPKGTIWRENGQASYRFESESPDGRVVLRLHLLSAN